MFHFGRDVVFNFFVGYCNSGGFVDPSQNRDAFGGNQVDGQNQVCQCCVNNVFVFFRGGRVLQNDVKKNSRFGGGTADSFGI